MVVLHRVYWWAHWIEYKYTESLFSDSVKVTDMNRVVVSCDLAHVLLLRFTKMKDNASCEELKSRLVDHRSCKIVYL